MNQHAGRRWSGRAGNMTLMLTTAAVAPSAPGVPCVRA